MNNIFVLHSDSFYETDLQTSVGLLLFMLFSGVVMAENITHEKTKTNRKCSMSKNTRGSFHTTTSYLELQLHYTSFGLDWTGNEDENAP